MANRGTTRCRTNRGRMKIAKNSVHSERRGKENADKTRKEREGDRSVPRETRTESRYSKFAASEAINNEQRGGKNSSATKRRKSASLTLLPFFLIQIRKISSSPPPRKQFHRVKPGNKGIFFAVFLAAGITPPASICPHWMAALNNDRRSCVESNETIIISLNVSLEAGINRVSQQTGVKARRDFQSNEHRRCSRIYSDNFFAPRPGVDGNFE